MLRGNDFESVEDRAVFCYNIDVSPARIGYCILAGVEYVGDLDGHNGVLLTLGDFVSNIEDTRVLRFDTESGDGAGVGDLDDSLGISLESIYHSVVDLAFADPARSETGSAVVGLESETAGKILVLKILTAGGGERIESVGRSLVVAFFFYIVGEVGELEVIELYAVGRSLEENCVCGFLAGVILVADLKSDLEVEVAGGKAVFACLPERLGRHRGAAVGSPDAEVAVRGALDVDLDLVAYGVGTREEDRELVVGAGGGSVGNGNFLVKLIDSVVVNLDLGLDLLGSRFDNDPLVAADSADIVVAEGMRQCDDVTHVEEAVVILAETNRVAVERDLRADIFGLLAARNLNGSDVSSLCALVRNNYACYGLVLIGGNFDILLAGLKRNFDLGSFFDRSLSQKNIRYGNRSACGRGLNKYLLNSLRRVDGYVVCTGICKALNGIVTAVGIRNLELAVIAYGVNFELEGIIAGNGRVIADPETGAITPNGIEGNDAVFNAIGSELFNREGVDLLIVEFHCRSACKSNGNLTGSGSALAVEGYEQSLGLELAVRSDNYAVVLRLNGCVGKSFVFFVALGLGFGMLNEVCKVSDRESFAVLEYEAGSYY